MYYNRWQSEVIKEALETRRVLVLSGARQCGKTTLVKEVAGEAIATYRTLDKLEMMEAAQADPEAFIKHDGKLMIIDEIQRVPQLLQVVKYDVDQNQEPGRYLLTGSTNIQSLPQVNESLAGRVRVVRLRPISMGEYHATAPDFLEKAYKERFDSVASNGQMYDKDDYLQLCFVGGYPEALKLNERKLVRRWHKDYMNALMERDLKNIINIKRKDSMLKLQECLAAWSSKLIDISEIGVGLSIQRPTIESYINALESLYLIERLRPWNKTDYDRVGKKDKIFMADTGLMTSILKWRFGDVRLNGEKNGKVLETLVFNQLSAIIDAHEDDYEMFHYRDRLQREIDFIVESHGGELIGIEVKAGTSISLKSFKHLKWFRDNMAKHRKFIGIVLYTGHETLRFGEGMWAVPISALWGEAK